MDGTSTFGPSILSRVNVGGMLFALVWTQTSRSAEAGVSVK